MSPTPKLPGNLRSGGLSWVIIQSILMLAVVALGVLGQGDWTRVWVILTGAVLFLAGGVPGIAGVIVLGRNRTPFPQPRAGSELIQHGVYARMRHPLYTSVMVSSLGWALLWQSPAAVVAAVVLIPFFMAKARHEEHWLRARFPGYAEYARRVPAFWPRFRFKK